MAGLVEFIWKIYQIKNFSQYYDSSEIEFSLTYIFDADQANFYYN